jgi:hypothetical protein
MPRGGGKGGGFSQSARRHAVRMALSLHLRMTLGTSAGLAGMTEAQLASVAWPGASAAVIAERSAQTDRGPVD